MRSILTIALISLVLISCKKDELPVPKHDSGSVITSAVNMESNYKYQIYFDLKTNTVVGMNPKTAWDLGFEASPDGYHIVLNTSKAMYSYETEETDFDAVTDTVGYSVGRSWDVPSGNLDSTAIGNWVGENKVYVIDRGYSELGVHQGFRKIIFQNVNATEYQVKFANLNGSQTTELTIAKDDLYNFAFLSFTTSSVVMIEPPKADWDLVFTQYIHVFHEPEVTTYLVTGCLLNRSGTLSVMDNQTAFNAINFSMLGNYTLVNNMNTIGYEWKTFNGTTYDVDVSKNYIIQDRDEFHYKLHFIDFYDSNGVKGNPKWEYQEL